ncbi:defective in meristem silencing 3 [Euphorbia peplus]|nr:defective in meristem silencing 3 [Euphorbia peplus]
MQELTKESSPPVGFLDFAVNVINIDTWNLSYVTTDGHGLRETLFYALFSRLQVCRTRKDMLHARPCITKGGALSLDGRMIKENKVFALGDMNDLEVKFAVVTNQCYVANDYSRAEDEIRKLKWDRSKAARDNQREQSSLGRKKRRV